MSILPKKSTLALLNRYALIGRFSRYQSQSGIFSKLHLQYPPETGFVALPMDMANIGAGKPKIDIDAQLKELGLIRGRHESTFFPFVFADPRTMEDEKYFDYSVADDGTVTLTPGCVGQRCLEDEKFTGIKIYPALGYYPFDERLRSYEQRYPAGGRKIAL